LLIACLCLVSGFFLIDYQLRESMKETGLTEVFKLLNDNFGRVVASGDKDVTNLLFVLDVLFNVITYRTGALPLPHARLLRTFAA
jgi:hypothetical protein